MFDIGEILSEIGWDPGFKLPVANEFCQKLQCELTEKKQKSFAITERITAQRKKLANLKNHYHETFGDLTTVNKLLDSKAKEIESEEHIRKLSEGECAHVQARITGSQRQLEAVESRRDTFAERLQRLNEDVEQLKRQLAQDTAALARWLETMRQRDDDIVAMRQYRCDDLSDWHRLSRRLERLSVEERRVSGELRETDVALASAAQQVDRVADTFRLRHTERQHLVEQWEQVLMAIEVRERQIRAQNCHITDIETELAEVSKRRHQHSKFLDNEKKNNTEIEMKRNSAESMRIKFIEKNKLISEKYDEFQHKIDSTANMCYKFGNDLRQKQIFVKHLNKEIVRNKRIIGQIREKSVQVEKALEEARLLVLTAEEKNVKLVKLMQEEEREHKKLHSKISEISMQIFENTSVVNENKQREILKANQIKITMNVRAKLLKQLNDLNGQLTAGASATYQKDTVVEGLLKRIERMEGLKQDDYEYRLLQKRLKLLQKELSQLELNRNAILNQMKGDEHLLRSCQQSIQKCKLAEEDFKWKEAELRLHSECCGKELRLLVEQRQTATVQSVMVQLTLKQLAVKIEYKAGKCHQLGQLQDELEAMLMQRRAQAAADQEKRRLQLRSLQQEVSQLCRDVTSRREQTEQFRVRYKLLLEAMGGGQEKHEEQVHTYWLIRATQQREQMKLEGDALDAKVRKTECELQALRNTRDLIKQTNLNFENKLKSAKNGKELDQRDEEMLLNLENEQNTFKKLRVDLCERKSYLADLEGVIQQMEQEMSKLNAHKVRNENELLQQTKEVADQKDKLERAKRNVKLITKKFSKSGYDLKLINEIGSIRKIERRKLMKIVRKLLLDLRQLHPSYFAEEVADFGVTSTVNLCEDGRHSQSGSVVSSLTCYSDFSESDLSSSSAISGHKSSTSADISPDIARSYRSSHASISNVSSDTSTSAYINTINISFDDS